MHALHRLLAIILVAVGLSGCGSFSAFEGIFTAAPDETGSVRPSASVRQQGAQPSASTRQATALQAPTQQVAAFQASSVQRASALPRAVSAGQASGKVYIFRGMGGRIASFEMDRLADKLEKNGIEAEVYNHFNWRGPADEAVARYKRRGGQYPVMLVGHSAGADAAVYFAEKLKDSGVPVSLIVSFDPTRRPKAVPPNVDRFINIYQSLNVFGGGFVSPGSDFRGHYASIDLKHYWEVLHVNLVKMRGLQDQIIAKIVQIIQSPPPLEGETVPIHYVMPREEKIELWDSGLPVRAEEGETVRSIAAKYAVPAWAVAQINNLGASATLQAGQRLIIPRRLDAPLPSTLTSYAPRGQ